jgi:hypothetical protein
MRTFVVTAGLYSPGDLVGGLEAGRDELKTQFMTRQVMKFLIACLRGCAANPNHISVLTFIKFRCCFNPRPYSAQSRLSS